MAAASTARREADALAGAGAGAATMRGAAVRAAGYGAGLALSLVSVPLLIRHLGVAQFGRYASVVSLVALVGGLAEGGLSALALRELAASPERGELMRHLVGIRLATMLGAIALAVAFAAAAGYGQALVLGTLAAGAGMLAGSLQALLGSALQVRLQFGRATLADLSRQVVFVALVVVLIVAGAGLLPFFVASIPAGLAALAITVALLRGQVALRPALDRAAWGSLIRQSVPFAVATAVYAAYFRVAILAMSIVSTPLQTGYYATSFRVLEVAIVLPGLALSAALPLLSRAASEAPERFEQTARRVIELALIGGAFCALCLTLGASAVVVVLAGSKGAPAAGVLRIQGWALLASFLTAAATIPLLALRRNRDILLANLLAVCVVLALVAALVPSHAARGAAVATTLAELVLAAGLHVRLARARPAVGRAWRALPPVALATGAGAAVSLLPGLASVPQALLGAAAFAGALALLGWFPPELAQALGGRRARARAD